MIVVQLILLHQCLEYQYPIPPTSNRRWFWNWYQYRSYIIFLLLLTGTIGIFYLLFDKDGGVFIEILGFLVSEFLFSFFSFFSLSFVFN